MKYHKNEREMARELIFFENEKLKPISYILRRIFDVDIEAKDEMNEVFKNFVKTLDARRPVAVGE